MDSLSHIVQQLLTPGKGLLAADESVATAGKRFTPIRIANTEETRLAFRKMLLTAKGMEEYISGVILFDETIRESVDGKRFVDILLEHGILPGIKVDGGLQALSNGENVTKGLEGLETRLEEYKTLGATFCKWRSLFVVTSTTPSPENILQNATDMASYALLCQQQGLIPIVEPEILMDGNHTREEAGQANTKVLSGVFEELQKRHVNLSEVILKTSMVIKGSESKEPETPQDVAKATIDVFMNVLPKNLGGIVFLSGGQSELEATENLQAISALRPFPWPITFSYSRALEQSAILAWNGKEENISYSQKVFLHRAKMNSLASLGKYTQDAEKHMV